MANKSTYILLDVLDPGLRTMQLFPLDKLYSIRKSTINGSAEFVHMGDLGTVYTANIQFDDLKARLEYACIVLDGVV